MNLVSLINEIPAGRDINSTTLENLLQQYVMSISPLIIFTTDIMPGIGFSFEIFHKFSRPGGLSACTSAPAALRGVGGGGGKERPNCDDTISTVMNFICFLRICKSGNIHFVMLAAVHYILISFLKNCTIIILSRPNQLCPYISKLPKCSSAILPSGSNPSSSFGYHHRSLSSIAMLTRHLKHGRPNDSRNSFTESLKIFIYIYLHDQ